MVDERYDIISLYSYLIFLHILTDYKQNNQWNGEDTGLIDRNTFCLFTFLDSLHHAGLDKTEFKTITNQIVYFECCHILLWSWRKLHKFKILIGMSINWTELKNWATLRKLKILKETENKNSVKSKRRKIVNGFLLLRQTISIRNSFPEKNFHKKKINT